MRIVPFLPDVRVGLDGISYEGHDFTAGQNKRQGEVQPWSRVVGERARGDKGLESVRGADVDPRSGE